jgi:hypothetical protein
LLKQEIQANTKTYMYIHKYFQICICICFQTNVYISLETNAYTYLQIYKAMMAPPSAAGTKSGLTGPYSLQRLYLGPLTLHP